eukprot:451119-Pleurochrysis_carterae.AAC.4
MKSFCKELDSAGSAWIQLNFALTVAAALDVRSNAAFLLCFDHSSVIHPGNFEAANDLRTHIQRKRASSKRQCIYDKGVLTNKQKVSLYVAAC